MDDNNLENCFKSKEIYVLTDMKIDKNKSVILTFKSYENKITKKFYWEDFEQYKNVFVLGEAYEMTQEFRIKKNDIEEE